MKSRFTAVLVGLSSLALAACSSSDSENNAGTGGGGSTGGSSSETGGDQGSNGGNPSESGTGGTPSGECDDTALASATKPCKPDADPCNLKSGYPGDEYCILPPPEGKGIQIHFGPTDYKDPEEIAKYIIHPGEEYNAYGLATIPGGGDHFYNYTQIRMRPGSHHLINQLVTGTESMPDGFIDGKIGCPGTPVGGFPGTQNLIRNMPPGGQQAPENVGLGSKLLGSTRLCVNHHGYNYNTDGDALREVWINVWFVDEKDVSQVSTPIFVIAGPWQGIAPHTQTVLKQSATVNNVSDNGRIINMFGHRHAWTDRFAVWKNEDLVYDSWHWEESIAFDYDSVTKNPPLNPDGKEDGAPSGVMNVANGDKVSIECDIDNKSDNTLTFRNELYGGEMCILFGASVNATVRGGIGSANFTGGETGGTPSPND